MLVRNVRWLRTNYTEGRIVQSDRRQNLKSYKINCVLSMNFIVYVRTTLMSMCKKGKAIPVTDRGGP
jgi:hypothetical protein